mgnify:CR=1 FL=1
MLSMLQIDYIKKLYAMGLSISEIAREANVDRKTVRKWIQLTDFSPQIPLVKVLSLIHI